MNDIEETIFDRILKKEGFSSTPYNDTEDVLTFGHGLTFPVTEEESRAVVKIRLKNAIREAIVIFPDLWNFGNARATVVVDMMYNLGYIRFKEFTKMISAIHDRDWERAADEAKNSRWYSQVKTRGKENVSMLLTGEFPKGQ